MSAQPQYLPVPGRIDLLQPSTVTFKGVPARVNESIEEAVASGNLECIAVAMSKYLSNLYLNAPYLQGATGGNIELTDAVIMKYMRSRPDWEPTEELPALKPTITNHKFIRHWLRKVAKTTHIDLCRAYGAHRAHYVLATDLIPAGAENFDSLEWAQGLQYGGAESSSEVRYSSECEQGNSSLAGFYRLKNGNKKTGKDDWCKSERRLDKEHSYSHPELLAVMDKLKELEIPLEKAVFTESCRSWTRVVPMSKGEMVLEPLNNPLKASSASKPYSKGQRYPFFREEALVILGQALSKLTAEERGRIRQGWEDADYCPDHRRIANRLKKLCASSHVRNPGRPGSSWAFEQFCELIDSPRGLMGLYDEYAGWSSPIIVAERTPFGLFPFRLVTYHPRNTTIPVIQVSEPVENDFRLFFPSAGNETPSQTYHRYRGADVEILEDGAGDLRLIRYICDERASQWVPADELIAPKKRVSKRAQQVSQMYRCAERECSCKPVHKDLKDKLACRDNDCRCRPANPPYASPIRQNDREKWLVAIGQPADWKRPEYLGRK